MTANIFEPYRVFLSGEPYLKFPFETLDELFGIEPFPTHMNNVGFSHFVIDGSTIFAVYEDKLWTVGWVENIIDILKPPYPSRLGRVYPLAFKLPRENNK